MPTSYCYNCGAGKNPPYTQRYCDECEKAVANARQFALDKGFDPSEAGRRALAERTLDPRSNRPNPRQPYTTADYTRNVLNAQNRELPPELGG